MSTARPLRIIQVFNRYLQAGGEEKSVGRIAEDLAGGGHHVVRFWRASSEWTSPGGPPRVRQALLLWNNRAVLDELEALHRRERADLWLLHNVIPVVSLGVYRRALRVGVPIIQWLHNYRPISVGGALFAGPRRLTPEDPWGNVKEAIAGSWNGRLQTTWLLLAYAWIRRRGDYESVKAWVAVSEEMKRGFARARWFTDRLDAVPHSWHLQSQAPATDPDQGHFLFLGRMIEPKGVRFIVDLWRDPAFRDHTLVMAGQGPLAEELRPNSPPNIRWVGQISGEEKRRWIAGSRAIVFPCLWDEPLSTVAYEAYEAGRPVLSSAMGGMKEIVFDGVTGRLLRPGDAAAWRAAILGLDASQARTWGLEGRRWLEANVTPEAWNARFQRIADRVVGRDR
jgi:glycosyltransferase involved in cell wall biosynthesis